MGSRILCSRLDPVSLRALDRLAEAWQTYRRDGSPNRSEALRRAIVYSYLVYVKGIDPARASSDLEVYMIEELTRLGMSPPPREGKRRMRIWG